MIMNYFKLLFAFLCISSAALAMEESSSLVTAAKIGNLVAVRKLLDAGVNINQEINSETALMCASWEGHLPIVQLLIDRNANVNYISSRRSTALMWAACNGKSNILQLLINRGAFVNLVNDSGSTALALAEYNSPLPNCFNCCELLVEHMLKMPTKKQIEKFWLILKKIKESNLGHDIQATIKPYLRAAIEQENREYPNQSIAFREIRKILDTKVKKQLLEKYYPNSKPQLCLIQ